MTTSTTSFAQPQISNSQPAQPSYILRGHSSQVHALCFLRGNSRLVSGDAHGFVILWDTATKRAVAVWQAHKSAILGLSDWGDERIISHGRDNSLKVWQIRSFDEGTFSTSLPVEGDVAHRKEPWLLHSLAVNTLNFCAFSRCDEKIPRDSRLTHDSESKKRDQSILISVPGTREGHVDIFSLPSERRLYAVPPAEEGKTGMVMALRITYIEASLFLVSGYESGLTSVQKLVNPTLGHWETVHISKSHTQPILSLDVTLHTKTPCYFTSGADSVIAMNSLQRTDKNAPLNTIQTKHSGQQSLTVRSDGKIFATAGWDSRVRVYSTKTLSELAVLKWHNNGCYAVAFATLLDEKDMHPQGARSPTAMRTENSPRAEGPADSVTAVVEQDQAVNTVGMRTVKQRREGKARETHWLAAGSKDGKVSLWEIY